MSVGCLRAETLFSTPASEQEAANRRTRWALCLAVWLVFVEGAGLPPIRCCSSRLIRHARLPKLQEVPRGPHLHLHGMPFLRRKECGKSQRAWRVAFTHDVFIVPHLTQSKSAGHFRVVADLWADRSLQKAWWASRPPRSFQHVLPWTVLPQIEPLSSHRLTTGVLKRRKRWTNRGKWRCLDGWDTLPSWLRRVKCADGISGPHSRPTDQARCAVQVV